MITSHIRRKAICSKSYLLDQEHHLLIGILDVKDHVTIMTDDSFTPLSSNA
jgi:hypothetical protein